MTFDDIFNQCSHASLVCCDVNFDFVFKYCEQCKSSRWMTHLFLDPRKPFKYVCTLVCTLCDSVNSVEGNRLNILHGFVDDI